MNPNGAVDMKLVCKFIHEALEIRYWLFSHVYFV